MDAWHPAAYVSAIGFVILAEFLAQGWLFIEDHEEMYSEGDGGDDGDRWKRGVTEDDPEADPASGETHVHGVADVAIKADYN